MYQIVTQKDCFLSGGASIYNKVVNSCKSYIIIKITYSYDNLYVYTLKIFGYSCKDKI